MTAVSTFSDAGVFTPAKYGKCSEDSDFERTLMTPIPNSTVKHLK